MGFNFCVRSSPLRGQERKTNNNNKKDLTQRVVLVGRGRGLYEINYEKKKKGSRRSTPSAWRWKLLRISYQEHKTNDWVRGKINFLVGPHEPHLATVKRQKLAWFGHVTCSDSIFRNHPSGHLGGWATPWSVEEMMNGQHQKVDVPSHARTVHNGLLQKKKLEKNIRWIVCHAPPPPPPDPIGQGI